VLSGSLSAWEIDVQNHLDAHAWSPRGVDLRSCRWGRDKWMWSHTPGWCGRSKWSARRSPQANDSIMFARLESKSIPAHADSGLLSPSSAGAPDSPIGRSPSKWAYEIDGNWEESEIRIKFGAECQLRWSADRAKSNLGIFPFPLLPPRSIGATNFGWGRNWGLVPVVCPVVTPSLQLLLQTA